MDGGKGESVLIDHGEVDAASELHHQWQQQDQQLEPNIGALPAIDWGLPSVLGTAGVGMLPGLSGMSPWGETGFATQDAQSWLSSRYIAPSAFEQSNLVSEAAATTTGGGEGRPRQRQSGLRQQQQQRRVYPEQQQQQQQRRVYPEQQPGGRAVVRIAGNSDKASDPSAASLHPATPAVLAPFSAPMDDGLPSRSVSPLIAGGSLLLDLGSPSPLPEAGNWQLESPLPSLELLDVDRLIKASLPPKHKKHATIISNLGACH